MRALVVQELTGPDGIALAEVPVPPDADGQVVLEVHAAGVAFPDLLRTRGRYRLQPEPPFILGSEVAGVVRSAPAGWGLEPGRRAVGFLENGGFAEFARVPVAHVVPIADGMSFETAVALLVNYHTAFFALDRRGALRAGETLVVHGGAGGVGTAAIQVGRALGAKVLATARGEEGMRVAVDAGADEVVEVVDGWRDRLWSLTGGGADVILDPVGGEMFDASVRCLAPEGRLLVVGFAGGTIPSIKVDRLLPGNVSVVGVAWGAFLELEPELMARTSEVLARMAQGGYVAPIIGARYPLADGAQALRDLADRRIRGKPVLTMR